MAVGGYSLDGLADQWDNIPDVRVRLRENMPIFLKGCDDGTFVKGHVDKNQLDVKANAEIAKPLLTFMRHNDRKLPGIDDVVAQVIHIYEFNKKVVDDSTTYQESWACRRVLQYIKSMIYRPYPPQDSEIKRFVRCEIHACSMIGDYVI